MSLCYIASGKWFNIYYAFSILKNKCSNHSFLDSGTCKPMVALTGTKKMFHNVDNIEIIYKNSN